MRIVIYIFIVLLNVLNAKMTDVSLVLSWKNQFQFAGYYVAKEKGFYKDVGLNVSINEYDLNRDISKDVATQKVDFGIGHSSLILDKLNNYPNIVMLTAINQSSPLILLAKKSSNIQTIADIKNKKIMMGDSQTYTASINAMLHSEGLTQNSFRSMPTSFNPIDIINGNADLMVSYTSNEPFTLKEKGVETTIFDPKDYGYDFYSDILFTSTQMTQKNPKVVDAFYRASIKGWKYAYAHEEEAATIILNKYNTQKRSLKSLLYEGKVLKKLAIKDGVKFGDINPLRLKEIATIYRILGLIKENEKIDYENFIYNPLSKKKFVANEKEKEYLLKKQHLKVCVNPDNMPFQGVEENHFIGIASDFIVHLEKSINTSFEIVHTESINNSISFLKNKQCDIIPVFKGKSSHDTSLYSTSPYIKIPLTIVTHKESDYVFQLEDIETKSLGILEEELSENEFPGMNMIKYNSTEEGIKNVLSKKDFAFIGDLISVKKSIQSIATKDIQLINNINKSLPIHMLTRVEDNILNEILEKQIVLVTQSQKHAILNKWMNAEYIKSFDYSFLWPLLWVILIILLFIVYTKIHMNKLLRIKTNELNAQMLIFDENISASHTNVDGIITYVSKAYCKKSGYTQAELIGKTHALMRDEDTPDSLYQDMWMTITSAHTWKGEIKNVTKDGSEYWANCTISPILCKDKRILGFSAIREDVTLEKVLQNYNKELELEVTKRTIQLEKLSTTDKLTNINNRVKLDSMLTTYIENFKRYKQTFSLLVLDIDFFKKVNDNFGHLKGDEVLQTFASILKSSIRSVDTLGRWGGEEFMIICPNSTVDGAMHLAENIRRTVEEHTFSIDSSVTTSIGVAEVSELMTEKDIIESADNAMYRAKENGRNRVERAK